MTSDSRRLTLSILLASSLHAAVATSLLIVEPPEREPFPEGEYIELGAIEVPQGMQVVQPNVDQSASKKVIAKPEVVTKAVVEPKPQPVLEQPSNVLPEKVQDNSEVALQPEAESSDGVVTEATTAAVVDEETTNALADDENSEAHAQEMLAEESKVFAEEKAAFMAKKQLQQKQKPKIDPVLERRKRLKEKRLAQLQKSQMQRAQRWKSRKKQIANSAATSTPYGLPDGSRDARTLSQLPGNPKPVYPAPARRKGWQGNVVLAYYVTPSGHVQSLKVLRSSGHQILDMEAARAISRYRYNTGQAGWTYHPVQFSLSGQAQVEFSGLRTQ